MNHSLSEEQQTIYDFIYKQIMFGFYSNEDVFENTLDEIEILGYGDAITEEWVEDTIENISQELEKSLKDQIQTDDVSKLIASFDDLCQKNIVALHFPGYDDETSLEEVEEIERTLEENNQSSLGYCYYTGEELEHAIDSNELILKFQKLNNESDSICKEIGNNIVEVLTANGLTVAWNGKANSPIVCKNFEWKKKFDDAERDLLNYNYVIESILL